MIPAYAEAAARRPPFPRVDGGLLIRTRHMYATQDKIVDVLEMLKKACDVKQNEVASAGVDLVSS